MAGDWIKMRKSLACDPDVLQIAEYAGVNRFDALGKLHVIWSWADDHSEDGHKISVTISFLDELVSCTGFCSAMRTVGWLDGRDWSLTLPHFARHNGATAKKRALDCERKNMSRRRAEDCHAGKRTEVGLEKRREEKRRGEKKTPLPPLPENLDNEKFKAILDEWIVYKGSAYKPRGLQSLLTQASRLATEHGLPTVLEAFQTAMSNGWAGWNQPSSFAAQSKSKSGRKPRGLRIKI